MGGDPKSASLASVQNKLGFIVAKLSLAKHLVNAWLHVQRTPKVFHSILEILASGYGWGLIDTPLQSCHGSLRGADILPGLTG
jgi:hypothetical protein